MPDAMEEAFGILGDALRILILSAHWNGNRPPAFILRASASRPMPPLWRIPLTFALTIMSIGMLPIHSVPAQQRSYLPQSSTRDTGVDNNDATGSTNNAQALLRK